MNMRMLVKNCNFFYYIVILILVLQLNYSDEDSFFTINEKISMWKRNYSNLLSSVNIDQQFGVSSPAVVNMFNIQETNVVRT